MTVHTNMFDRPKPQADLDRPEEFDAPLVWYGTWNTPNGMRLNGFHVWDMSGRWVGVYKTQSRAISEASRFT